MEELEQLEHLKRMFARQQRRKNKATDILVFPKEHTKELIDILQGIEEKKRESKTACITERYRLWEFVQRCLPATRGKNCSIDTSHALRILIEIEDNYKVPVVGKDGVLAVHVIPKEHIYKYLELADAIDSGPAHRYAFWKFIESLFPDVGEDFERAWEIAVGVDFCGVFTKKKDEDSDD